MRKETVTLRDGLTIGETKHTEAEIREVTAGDLIEATEDGQRLVQTPEGEHILVSSDTLVGLHTLRRQIVRIGSYQGPLSMAELKKLSAWDLSLLHETAKRIDEAAMEAASRGRD